MTEVSSTLSPDYVNFLEDLKRKVFSSRYQAARVVNNELILLYHYIGTQILQKQKDRGWGSKILKT